MVGKALAWQHFGVLLGDGYGSIAALFTNEGEQFFERMLASGKKYVAGGLGQGTFTYEGTQAPQYPEFTLWRFRIYGGIDFGGDPRFNGPSSLAIAVTGRTEMIQNLRYSSFFKDPKSPKVGRNDPCPCGSGKKHKKCCGSVIKQEYRERALACRREAHRAVHVPTARGPRLRAAPVRRDDALVGANPVGQLIRENWEWVSGQEYGWETILVGNDAPYSRRLQTHAHAAIRRTTDNQYFYRFSSIRNEDGEPKSYADLVECQQSCMEELKIRQVDDALDGKYNYTSV